MKINEHGFTLLEIIVVLILIGVISVVFVSRTMNIQQIDLETRTAKVQTHIRYAQTMAMKRSDTIWGIKCYGTDYWLFRTNDPDTESNQVQFLGESSVKVPMSSMGAFTLFFDKYGIPYTSYTDENTNDPVSAGNALSIQIDSENFNITPETGFIQ
jgi:prepilin-type N-terminal cleavage/methylation domain-containing protein